MTMLTDDREMDPAAEGAQARLSTAWHWLCEQRAGAPEQADVWDIRWQHLNTGEGWLTALEGRLLRGTYRLSPLQLHGQGAQRRAVWGAQDALVLKWVALSLQHLLPLHPSCEHVKGHGGGKPSIETLQSMLTPHTTQAENPAGTPHYRWVCRTDIRGYYRNIRRETLMQQVRQHVISPVLRDLVHQYLHYTVEDGGTFHTPEKGISRGCPLSPLMGALHLYDMDAHFSRQQGIHYARYMDDVIILAKSRWSLRKQTRQLMQWFSEYGFEAHPDKTFIGRTEKGFDWMGAWLTHEGVTDIAPRAKANHREKVRRLYERLARVPFWKRKRAQKQVHARVSAYRLRWNIWAAGVLCMASAPTLSSATVQYVSDTTTPGTIVWSTVMQGTPGDGWVDMGTVTYSPPYNDYLYNSQLAGAINNVISQATGVTYTPTKTLIPGTSLYGYRLRTSSPFYITLDPIGGATAGAKAWGGATCSVTVTGSDTSGSMLTGYTQTGTVPGDSVTSTSGSAGVLCDNSASTRSNTIGGFSMYKIGGTASVKPSQFSVRAPTLRVNVIYAPSTGAGSRSISSYQAQYILGYNTSASVISANIWVPQFILTSMTCQLSASASLAIALRTDVPVSPSQGGTVPLDSGLLPTVQVECSGVLAGTDPAVNVGVTFGPAGGTALVAGRTDAVSPLSDPGHYLTLNSASPTCVSDPNNVDLTGDGSALQLGTVPSGGTAGRYSNGHISYALCTTPGTQAVIGTHTIGLTASSTMY